MKYNCWERPGATFDIKKRIRKRDGPEKSTLDISSKWKGAWDKKITKSKDVLSRFRRNSGRRPFPGACVDLSRTHGFNYKLLRAAV